MKSRCARALSTGPLARLALFAAVMLITASAFAADPAEPSFPAAALAHAHDDTFGYYPYGLRGRDAEGNIVFAVETSNYALVVNASKARVERLGLVDSPLPASDAVARNREFLDSLPPTTLEFSVVVDGDTYTAVEAAPKPDSVVLQRMGRFLQHFEINGVVLRHPTQGQLRGVTGKLIFYCWPDRISATLELTQNQRVGPAAHRLPTPMDLATLSAQLTPPAGDEFKESSSPPTGECPRRFQTGRGWAFLSAPGQCVVGDRGTATWRPEYRDPGPDPPAVRSITAIVMREDAPKRTGAKDAATFDLAPPAISAEGISPYTGPLAVSDDPIAGWTKIVLGANGDIQKNERVRVKIVNLSDKPQTARLNFAKEGGAFGVTGMSPMLRDLNGLPLGVPLQISKNWHSRPGWFSGITELEVPPGETLEFEFTLAYAKWGGVPAVSHAQLCLDGYGGNQQWDEMAIGSFGESICYDPDVNLTRSMVDDVRPLMVWGMGKTEKIQWSWTHNVGGADFLNLFTRAPGKLGEPGEPVADAKLTKQYLTSQKTLYASQGPVMSDVTYAGEALGGAIQSCIRARSWRTDDCVRALYSIRYDATRPSRDIARLAFFQMGADRYNENVFKKITRGDLSGERETWTPEAVGGKYSRRGVALEGETPWFALYEASKPPNIAADDKGAWANRGLIVRSWRARLGGADCPTPFYSVYGTGSGAAAAALVELSPPPGLEALEPGDFVEAQVEMVIHPQRAEDYYGPNDLFRAALAAHPDDWGLVHREVVGTNLDLKCSAGTVEETWPVTIRAENGKKARFTLRGGANNGAGVGYTPVTIAGAASPGPFEWVVVGGEGGPERRIDQSDMGNDWWQSDYDPARNEWTLTFTLPLDELRGSANDITLEWRLRD